MSWMDILIPSLADFKTKAGWSEGGDTPSGEEQTVSYTYDFETGSNYDITWNTISGGTITQAETVFPGGGFNLVQESGTSKFFTAVKEALEAAGCTVDFWDDEDASIWIQYTYNGTQESFTLTTTPEDTYTLAVAASDGYIDVNALRNRSLNEVIYVTDDSTNAAEFIYMSPSSVGLLPTAENASINFDTTLYDNAYAITFDPDTKELDIQVTEWFYMNTANVTIAT